MTLSLRGITGNGSLRVSHGVSPILRLDSDCGAMRLQWSKLSMKSALSPKLPEMMALETREALLCVIRGA